MGEEVNGLGEILFPQAISPNFIVGRQEGFNGFLGIPILGIPLPAHFEEKSLAVSTVTQYLLDIIGVLLKLGGHSSNILRVI